MTNGGNIESGYEKEPQRLLRKMEEVKPQIENMNLQQQMKEPAEENNNLRFDNLVEKNESKCTWGKADSSAAV